MRNEDYFEYIKKKSFEEKLRALCDAVESMTRQSYKASESGIGDENRKWYSSESKAQGERADFLYRMLIEEHISEEKLDIVDKYATEAKEYAKEVRRYLYDTKNDDNELYNKAHYVHTHMIDVSLIVRNEQ